MAKELQRPVRETVTPAVLQKVVWAGANLRSFPQAVDALQELAGIELSAKQVRRMTEQVGQDRLDERKRQVVEFKDKPLMERLESPAGVESPEVGVVMMDGGRYQRRDHFGEEDYDGSHWKEDKVGIVLRLHSDVSDCDPHPEFPAWLAHADVVAQIASLGAMDEEQASRSDEYSSSSEASASSGAWDQLSPGLLWREVIASSECGDDFGHHLEFAAWQNGLVAAPRMAFVADGASVNWTIHRQHFSQMTGILDLMHALSYAWKAAKSQEDPASYRRYARWIWQGEVSQVIEELESLHSRQEETSPDASVDDSIDRAITYFTNHQHLMDYPAYRKSGLPLTSSHIESTIKQINIRIKGSEKFFRHDTGETLLQLRADSISDSRPLNQFWPRWLSQQNGANTYRTQSA
ncbi:MAG: hypothetical protein DWQ34_21035 [Planctomycetota bacterium]|nr:MAG: hypothetical protein DWQ34_21035 [Planctomycetota bacterium]REJ94074.1 MAG: hypothetical protein DWQ29_03255 [Planctomycetota bacterium]REK20622.1 MAG: hypothetical protein DWQ41_24470 [Planctomycetota bacterium]